MAKQNLIDRTILEAALVGLAQEKAEIEAKMVDLRRMLRSSPSARSSGGSAFIRRRPATFNRVAAAHRQPIAGLYGDPIPPEPPKRKAKPKKLSATA
jgi:hypothetical protein